MIEVMPFLHILANRISESLSDDPEAIIPTTLLSYAISTILTGVTFLLLGTFKLGHLVSIFPRHILIGCVAGIGAFLLITGVEVTTSSQFSFKVEYIKFLFDHRNFPLWSTALGLAFLLKLIQRFVKSPLLTPMFYLILPFVFYFFVFVFGLSIADVRDAGWLFQFGIPDSPREPWYTFWTWFDFSHLRWDIIPSLLPVMLALVSFGVLHLPINIPALAASTNQDVGINRELIAHGVSNILSGLMLCPPNYLVYSNSLLYIRSGGAPEKHIFLTKIASAVLSLTTFGILIAGGQAVSYVPVVVVGSLIFLIGIELVKEGLVDTWRVVHGLEYFTIVMIVLTMVSIGFSEGILVGVVAACVFFVYIYSRKNIVRSTYSGAEIRSTVHRLYRQQVRRLGLGSYLALYIDPILFFSYSSTIAEN